MQIKYGNIFKGAVNAVLPVMFFQVKLVEGISVQNVLLGRPEFSQVKTS